MEWGGKDLLISWVINLMLTISTSSYLTRLQGMSNILAFCRDFYNVLVWQVIKHGNIIKEPILCRFKGLTVVSALSCHRRTSHIIKAL